MKELYFLKIAAAFIRGRALNSLVDLPDIFIEKPLEELSQNELAEIFHLGLRAGLKLHKFKKTMALARVQRVFGILRALSPQELLDVGSGRGTFLWPLVDSFPELTITSIDKDIKRVEAVQAVKDGGLYSLNAYLMDATNIDFPDSHFDVVTILEVLEHIKEAQQALSEVVRCSRRFVILSVPSKPDDNPEHINLFNQRSLEEMFKVAGAQKVTFEYVLNHIIAVAKK
ncbi:MAG: methyltransferase domain-containing protein [Blastocatellia bacterium]|nr:methyltransferase domain-containing protein [Blastocatellia bacterium]